MSAVCALMPNPPARVDMMYTNKWEPGALNTRKSSVRRTYNHCDTLTTNAEKKYQSVDRIALINRFINYRDSKMVCMYRNKRRVHNNHAQTRQTLPSNRQYAKPRNFMYSSKMSSWVRNWENNTTRCPRFLRRVSSLSSITCINSATGRSAEWVG